MNAAGLANSREKRRAGTGWLAPSAHGFAPFILLCLIVAAAGATGLRASDTIEPGVEVVRSAGAKPYVDAGAVIQQTFTADHYFAETVDLADLTDHDAARFKACLAAGKVRLFVAIGTQAAEWLQAHLPATMGLVYCMVADPAAAGLFQGHRSFGVSMTVSWQEQLKVLQGALPQARKVGVLYAKNNPASCAALDALRAKLPAGFELVAVAVDDSDNVSDAIQEMFGAHPDVVWTSPDSAVYNTATVRSLLLLALRHHIPVFGFSTPLVRAGALFGVGIEPKDQGAQCAALAESYLAAIVEKREEEFAHHASVEPPKFEVAVNEIVAKQLGCDLPSAFTDQATVVVKPD
ncbi:MAG: ABC transporter substrate-binding protein [Planctomycetota bacterium]